MNALLKKIQDTPQLISFNEVIKHIENNFSYTPTHFTNGKGEKEAINEAGTNEGSCKIFAFALLENLTMQQTLHCFGDYYRVDVLENPNNSDHANIRNFIAHGFDELHFKSNALSR